MFSPNSMDEFLRREESAERREEAISRRYRRQQYELFDEVDADPPCPNCGEFGYEPVYGVSEDASTGYHAEEQACVACMGRAF
jgi:hypothetical protein